MAIWILEFHFFCFFSIEILRCNIFVWYFFLFINYHEKYLDWHESVIYLSVFFKEIKKIGIQYSIDYRWVWNLNWIKKSAAFSMRKSRSFKKWRKSNDLSLAMLVYPKMRRNKWEMHINTRLLNKYKITLLFVYNYNYHEDFAKQKNAIYDLVMVA